MHSADIFMNLHDKHGTETGEEGDQTVDELGPKEASAAFCEEGDRSMSVLRYRAGKEHRERYDSCSEESYEYEVRTRLRNYAYQRCQEDHQGSIVADPSVDLHILQDKTEHQQDSESPCKYYRKMLLDDMLPEVFLNEMVGSKKEDQQDDHAQSGKQDIHPVLAQQIYMVAMSLFDVAFLGMLMVYM